MIALLLEHVYSREYTVVPSFTGYLWDSNSDRRWRRNEWINADDGWSFGIGAVCRNSSHRSMRCNSRQTSVRALDRIVSRLPVVADRCGIWRLIPLQKCCRDSGHWSCLPCDSEQSIRQSAN